MAIKTPAKALILVSAALIALPVAAWLATFLYWHFRITDALRVLENRASGLRLSSLDHDDSYEILLSSGCRCLPYLVSAAESPENRFLHDELLYRIVTRTRVGDGVVIDQDLIRARGVLGGNPLLPDDSPEDRRQKAGRIRDWWSADGHRFHQWWRVWTSHCR